MPFFKKPKKNNSVGGQLGGLVRQIGVEVVGELKETGKELLGIRPREDNQSREQEKNWADEWLKDKDPSKPAIADKTGQHSPLDIKSPLQKETQENLKLVQSRLKQMYTSSPKEQQTESAYSQAWKEDQEKKPKNSQKPASVLKPMTQKRKRGDWMGGAKRKRQATPQELNRTEFRGSKGQ